jgi:hypothetical protein
VAVRAPAERPPGSTGHSRDARLQNLGHMGGGWVAPARVHSPGASSLGRAETRWTRAPWRWAHPRGAQGSDGLGDSGDKPQQGEPIIALTAPHGDGRSPVPGAPVHATARVLRPKGLHALKRVAKPVGLTRTGADRHLDAGGEAPHTRQGRCHAGRLPHLTENPRPRPPRQRGRTRVFKAALPALRTGVARTFAWEETFTRLRRRFDHLQPRHLGMQWLAYTLLQVREFCGA